MQREGGNGPRSHPHAPRGMGARASKVAPGKPPAPPQTSPPRDAAKAVEAEHVHVCTTDWGLEVLEEGGGRLLAVIEVEKGPRVSVFENTFDLDDDDPSAVLCVHESASLADAALPPPPCTIYVDGRRSSKQVTKRDLEAGCLDLPLFHNVCLRLAFENTRQGWIIAGKAFLRAAAAAQPPRAAAAAALAFDVPRPRSA